MEESRYLPAAKFMRILSANSPVRDPAGTVTYYNYKTKSGKIRQRKRTMPQEIKRHGKVVSPYPGNLMNNGTYCVDEEEKTIVTHGGEPAPYALYANKRSRKPGYIEESIKEFRANMFLEGWEEDITGGSYE